MERLLITGAAGGLGRMLRERMRGRARVLRLSDVAPLAEPGPGEEIVRCDLADAGAVREMVAGCDAILHFGGISVEQPFEPILKANILGLYNLYEAARAAGRPRILFASSNHVTGFHPVGACLDARAELRPDSLYGVSKCFGEALARMYYEKFGQETLVVRIGSCTPEPRDYRALSTWLSPDDLVALIDRMLEVPVLGCPIVYGASANSAGWWDNSAVAWLGWQPRDNSAGWRARILARDGLPARDDPVHRHQGGLFCLEPIHDSDDATA